jgi:hypothetical protein
MTTTLPRPAPAPGGSATAPRVSTAYGVLGPSVSAGVAVLLASLSVAPLVDSGGWFGATFVTVVLVVAAGGLATWGRLPVFLVPILQAAALFATLVWRFVGDAPLGFVPSPDALGELRLVLAEGMSSVNRFAPPIPPSSGVNAVVALGIGCVTIVVFVLAVCLRMPVAASLALTTVYVVPSLVLDAGAPWWTFAAVATGWMVLLISDERVGLVSWGRVLRRADASAALRLGGVAILASVLLPIVVPSLADAVLGRNSDGLGGAGTGSGGVPAQVALSPFVSLRRDLVQQSDVVVMRYTTTATSPSYLRTVVLEDYVDERWQVRGFSAASSTRVADGTPLGTAPAADVAATPEHYSITADALVNPYLPVPEGLTSLSGITGQWYVDSGTGTIFGVASDTRGQRWEADAVDATPTPAQLQAAQGTGGQDLESLRDASAVPAVVAETARTVTAGATTSFERALALQRWFRTSFTYSTDVTSDQSSSYLEQFLTDRKGYCQQFAATMALMARSLGIPARVVVPWV